VCDRTSGLQTAHLVAVSEAPQLALRRRNTVLLCRADHLAFDSWVGVIPRGSRLWVDPQPRIARNPLAFGLLVAERQSLRIAYRLGPRGDQVG
jgi:hypothetical protein